MLSSPREKEEWDLAVGMRFYDEALQLQKVDPPTAKTPRWTTTSPTGRNRKSSADSSTTTNTSLKPAPQGRTGKKTFVDKVKKRLFG